MLCPLPQRPPQPLGAEPCSRDAAQRPSPAPRVNDIFLRVRKPPCSPGVPRPLDSMSKNRVLFSTTSTLHTTAAGRRPGLGDDLPDGGHTAGGLSQRGQPGSARTAALPCAVSTEGFLLGEARAPAVVMSTTGAKRDPRVALFSKRTQKSLSQAQGKCCQRADGRRQRRSDSAPVTRTVIA